VEMESQGGCLTWVYLAIKTVRVLIWHILTIYLYFNLSTSLSYSSPVLQRSSTLESLRMAGARNFMDRAFLLSSSHTEGHMFTEL